jgi:hypothetical protein
LSKDYLILGLVFLSLTALPAYYSAGRAYDIANFEGRFNQESFGIVLKSVCWVWAVACTLVTLLILFSGLGDPHNSFWVKLVIVPIVIWAPGMFSAGLGGLVAALGAKAGFLYSRSRCQIYAAIGGSLGVYAGPTVAILLGAGGGPRANFF